MYHYLLYLVLREKRMNLVFVFKWLSLEHLVVGLLLKTCHSLVRFYDSHVTTHHVYVWTSDLTWTRSTTSLISRTINSNPPTLMKLQKKLKLIIGIILCMIWCWCNYCVNLIFLKMIFCEPTFENNFINIIK